MVLTNAPLKNFLQKLNALSKMVKWAIKLGDFIIRFTPNISINEQELVDLKVERTNIKDT